jgi:hypothetical protein
MSADIRKMNVLHKLARLARPLHSLIQTAKQIFEA